MKKLTESLYYLDFLVDEHSLCPDNVLYNSNALAGEIGEVCNEVKKIQMAIIRPDWVRTNENSLPKKEVFEQNAREELGDVLFYIARLAKDLGTDIESLVHLQAAKLEKQTVKYNRKFLK